MDTQLSYAEQSLTNEQLVERYIAFKEKQKYYDEELKLMREALLNTYPTGKIGRASCRKECRSRWSPYH